MLSLDPRSNTPLKRRACDECRLRKLACSKEPDGCTRCVREGIRCHYSEQKPMGRPRKRQYNGEAKENNLELDSIAPEFDPLPYFDDYFQCGALADADGLQSQDSVPNYPILPLEHTQATSLFTVDEGKVFDFGDKFNIPIDFKTEDATAEDHVGPIEPKVQEPVRGRHQFESRHPIPSAPGPPCSCLAAMYLAMSSLEDFPIEVEAALATVRAAAKTAQAAVRCTKCGHCAATSVTPPIEAFQNVMLLGTILPIIVNGYKRLLVMVEEETEKAKAASINKIFRMSAYGGLCGQDTPCGAAKHLDGSVISPTEWRTAVRGLLRVDVYGMDGVTTGLKGLISEMEHRQLLRHKEMHQLGETSHAHQSEERQCRDEKDMLCMRILNTAKISIDALVIA